MKLNKNKLIQSNKIENYELLNEDFWDDLSDDDVELLKDGVNKIINSNSDEELLKNMSLSDALDHMCDVNNDWFRKIQFRKKEETEEMDKKKQEITQEVDDLISNGELAKEVRDKEIKKRMHYFAEKFKWPEVQVSNLLVIGPPGGGKTSIIMDWGKRRDIGVVKKTGAQITQSIANGYPISGDSNIYTDSNGKPKKVVQFLPSEFFDMLDNPYYEQTVLFIDEINRSEIEAEAALLTLIQDHEISDRNDVEHQGIRLFKKFLFTVAAMNPYNASTDPTARNLTQPMYDRFSIFFWTSNKKEYGDYMRRSLKNDQDLLQRMKATATTDKDKFFAVKGMQDNWIRSLIVDALCDSKQFEFYDPEYVVNEDGSVADGTDGGEVRFYEQSEDDLHTINARSVTSALMQCKTSTGAYPYDKFVENQKYQQGSFMAAFKSSCSANAQKLQAIEKILQPVEYKIQSRLAKRFDNTDFMNKIPVSDIFNNWLAQYNNTGATVL